MLEKLIVMLTHNDVTVEDAKEIFEANKDLPVQTGASRRGIRAGKDERALRHDEGGRKDYLSGSGDVFRGRVSKRCEAGCGMWL